MKENENQGSRGNGPLGNDGGGERVTQTPEQSTFRTHEPTDSKDMVDFDRARRTITLRSGIEIYMESLDQSATYGGQLEGGPSERLNDALIRSVKRRYSGDGRECHVIQPETRLVPERGIEGGKSWVEMPRYRCIGLFSSKAGSHGYGSEATLVWFQDHFAFPIDCEVLERIQALNWTRLAHHIDSDFDIF